MTGNKIKRTFITKFINNILKDKGKWPDVDRDTYSEMINKFEAELDNLPSNLSEAVKRKMADKQGSLRAMYYYLAHYSNIPEYYKKQVEKQIQENEIDLGTLHDDDSSKFVLNLTRILFEYLVFDYFQRGKKEWDYNIFNDRPKLKVCFGQHYCTKDTTFRRTELILRDFSQKGTKVLFLGDDDLGCLALASLADFEIHMLDLDRDIIKFVKSKNLGIKTHIINLQRGVPDEFKNYFDAVVLDPFWEFSGVEMFFEPAYVCLKKNRKSRMYLSICPFLMGEEKYGEIQRKILANGLVFQEILKHFSWYVMGENQNYSEFLDIFNDINEEVLKSIFVETAMKLPLFFSTMHVLSPV